MRVAAVILAAGLSRRFGAPKQLATLGGRTLVERVVDAAVGAGLDPVIVVAPPGFAPPDGAVVVRNAAPEQGLSHSLRLGIAGVPGAADAAVVLLGDQPTVSAGVLRSLVAAAEGDPDASPAVVAARTHAGVGPPVLVHRRAFWMVDEARGDTGLGPVLTQHPDAVTFVDVDADLLDVDTPEDLERLRRGEGGSGRLSPPTAG